MGRCLKLEIGGSDDKEQLNRLVIFSLEKKQLKMKMKKKKNLYRSIMENMNREYTLTVSCSTRPRGDQIKFSSDRLRTK